ncbi:hypothetical protein WBJ53_15415 [Spirosoma sp. SC4-14]|uniref:hypothetical protein n=1 Tax=Spirosoma sp. SC4-14 TaxID=3128900 RepID=UPI0030D0A647
MKRLSLDELKAQATQKDQLAQNVEVNLEAIKGGDVDWCHVAEVLKKIEQFIFF